MGFKKKSKVTTEFSSASMTDMIFLLLIFFMLTSGLVAPNSLNLKLPGSSQSKVELNSKADDVSITKSGNFYLNGKRITQTDLDETLGRKAKASTDKLDITISPESGTPIKYVAFVMDIAMRFEINAILAVDEK
ncbi:MAG: biopolymer transporter ExbD [Saprospiraceae bacterium]|nr:biopolymer transporter ExbD [Saprospiraceae bacterium]MCF8249269.1 biopolymer transporter ExbD [Saprospiraceae bacterium]MCF8281163.1 biopolymer transporter ExbD [Bacteroidales bacterium]MCF8311454.1 biopolymer transporter ExbD [Saprospiraceae bacterium]MCF8439888.1 biopolymer transporter ExbD [Saprospiraceae bacterium]